MIGNKWKKSDRLSSKLEPEIFAVFEPTEHEISSAADNPFLLRRLMVGISAEERRRAAEANKWSLSLGIAIRAVPGFAAIAMAVFGLFWYSSGTASIFGSVNDRGGRSHEYILATSELPVISNDDVESIMLGLRPVEARGEQ